jgi:DNA uptake protein ComE-like DNA-binding protein
VVQTPNGGITVLLKEFRGSATTILAMMVVCFLAGCNQSNENMQSGSYSPSPAASPIATQTTTPAAPGKKLNVNTATQAELLAAIPGLGNRMVHEFEEYRPYKSIQQFRREIGKYVDAQKVAEYENYIFVPIDVNQSDAATLMQIPGLDTAEAEELIASRPYASAQDFLAKLNGKISSSELETARSYLGTP